MGCIAVGGIVRLDQDLMGNATMQLDRRASMRMFLGAALGPALAGCAALTGRLPVRVNVVGLEPLPGEGMEARMAVKLRVQNPNDEAISYDGIAVDLDIDGKTLATGVSDASGTVGRYGETVLTVPMTISAMAVLRQVLGFARGHSGVVHYEVRGRLGHAGPGSTGFSSSGDIDFPTSIGVR
jgi:hypothetical protein